MTQIIIIVVAAFVLFVIQKMSIRQNFSNLWKNWWHICKMCSWWWCFYLASNSGFSFLDLKPISIEANLTNALK
jgi:NADH:ubiquinone oxidoreductase subunit 6 (subunit J)